MTDRPTLISHFRRRRLDFVARVGIVLVAAFVSGWLLNRTAAALEQRREPAGFVRGVIQGALMPCTLPALLLGHDVTIYSVNNSGVTYKLGYTSGVNLCGAAFFGLLYRRISRWRSRFAP
jgi:hypothetical protein